MRKTMFVARHWKIEPVVVEKETAQSVWIKPWTFAGESTGAPRRNAKRGVYENYFDTWAEAHDFMLSRAQTAVNDARSRLAQASAIHGNVKGMKEPA